MCNKNISKLQSKLNKSGYLNSKFIDGHLNIATKKAIKKYQKDFGVVDDGILTTDLYNAITGEEVYTNEGNGKYSREVYKNNNIETEDANTTNDSFFTDAKNTNLRKGTSVIKIKQVDDKNILITGVKYRSVGRKYDTSGEAVYEVYEFVGKDIIE